MSWLFDDITVTPEERRESKRAERQRKAKLAYDSTSEAWKRATYRFAVEEFLPVHATFVFEELTMAYDAAAKEKRMPVTVNGKAMAGLQRRLIKEERIVLIEGVTRTRSNGQDGKVYRSNLYQGNKNEP